jgi:hypothetical protein
MEARWAIARIASSRPSARRKRVLGEGVGGVERGAEDAVPEVVQPPAGEVEHPAVERLRERVDGEVAARDVVLEAPRADVRLAGLRVVALGARLDDLDDELPSTDLRGGEALKDGGSRPAELRRHPLQERHPVSPHDHHVDVLALPSEQPVPDESPDQEGLDPQLGGGEPDHLQEPGQIESRSHGAQAGQHEAGV